VSLAIATAGAERIDELEPLWLALHRHHRDVAAAPVVADDAASWERRRRWYLEMLAGGDDAVLIAEKDGMPVGYAFLHVHEGPDDTWPVEGRWAEVVSLSVLPSARGAGVGTALLDAVDAELERRGVRDLQVSVMAGNADAIRLYERRGLRPAELVLFRFGSEQDGGEAPA
jgi:GNAT superfamily N-acetyltransferase